MSYKQLTEFERYQICAMKKEGHSQKEIADCLHRSPSTISRELHRNGGPRSYEASRAHRRCVTRRREAYKAYKVTEQIWIWIVRLIEQDLSPQQTVDYLKIYKKVSLHHETVYQLIYADKAEGGELYKHLRIARRPYRKRYGHNDRRTGIPRRVGIEHRPAIVDRRTRIGDWEGDTVMGYRRKSAILTMVERKTLYTVIVRLSGKRPDLLAKAAVKHMKALQERVKTITFDNGREFIKHEAIAKGLNAKIYFAHPYASWERGINENTNGLIRQYFPKGIDFNKVTDKQIKAVMSRLNNRPRKTRGNKSPNELFMGQRVDLLAA